MIGRPQFTRAPWHEHGYAVYADVPQDVDHGFFRGFEQPEGDRGYLVAESIPHAPTRRLIADAPLLYDFVATIENDDGSLPDWLWDWRNRLLAHLGGNDAASPLPPSDLKEQSK